MTSQRLHYPHHPLANVSESYRADRMQFSISENFFSTSGEVQVSACLFVCFQDGGLVGQERRSWSLMRGEILSPVRLQNGSLYLISNPPFVSFHVCLFIVGRVTAPHRGCVFENQWLMPFEDGEGEPYTSASLHTVQKTRLSLQGGNKEEGLASKNTLQKST